MSEGLIVREANLSDAPALHDFFEKLFAEPLDTLGVRDRPPPIQEEIELISKMVAEKNSCLLLAFKDRTLAGTLDLQGCPHPQKQHSAGLRMSVGDRFRDQGIGFALLEAAIRFAQSNQLLTRIELEVFQNNEAAIHLYRKAQFRVEGTKREAVQINGKFIGVLSMALLLSEFRKDQPSA